MICALNEYTKINAQTAPVQHLMDGDGYIEIYRFE